MTRHFAYLRRPAAFLKGHLPDDVVALMQQHDDELEDWIASADFGDENTYVSAIPIFAPVGNNVEVGVSKRWYPGSNITVTRVFASLTATSTSGSVTIDLRKNGAAVATLSIPAGSFTAGLTVSVAYLGPETDYMQVSVTAAGTAAEGLTVHVR